jgi:hypothetical protein
VVDRCAHLRRHGEVLLAAACGRRVQLTSVATEQQQRHASAAVCARTLFHSCVHVMRLLTWSAVAALPLCAARQFELVRQRQALLLRNRCSLAERSAITIESCNQYEEVCGPTGVEWCYSVCRLASGYGERHSLGALTTLDKSCFHCEFRFFVGVHKPVPAQSNNVHQSCTGIPRTHLLLRKK